MAINVYTPSSEKIIHKTEVDFAQRMVQQVVNIVQYDKEIPIIEVSLYLNGEPYTIPNDASLNAQVRWIKKDRTFTYKAVLGCNSSRTIIYFDIDEQMSFYSGKLNPIIEINKTGLGVAGSQAIPVTIDPNPIQNGDIESKIDFKYLEDVLAEIERNAANAKTSETNAKTSETNAKTSETNAATSKTNAANSATNAANSATNAAASATTASTKATESSNSATNAAASATTASTKATESSNSATNAAASLKTIQDNQLSINIYRVVTAISNISSVSGSKIGDLFVTGDATSRIILGQSVSAIGTVIRSTSSTTGEILTNISAHASTRIINAIPGVFDRKLYIKTVATAWTTAANQTTNFPDNQSGDYIFNAYSSASSIFGISLASGGLVQITQGSTASILGVGLLRNYIVGPAGTMGLSTRFYNASATAASFAFTASTFNPSITATDIRIGDTALTSNGCLYRFATAGSLTGTLVKDLTSGSSGPAGISTRFYNAAFTAASATFVAGTFLPTITAANIQAGDTAITSNGYLYRFATAGSLTGTLVKDLNGSPGTAGPNGLSTRFYNAAFTAASATFVAGTFLPTITAANIQAGDTAITSNGYLYRFATAGSLTGTLVKDLNGPPGPTGIYQYTIGTAAKSFTITAATHGRGTGPLVIIPCFELVSGNNYKQSITSCYYDTTDGTVYVTTDVNVTGKILILGGAASGETGGDYLPLSGGTITGNLLLKGTGNYGNKINFGDGDYVHLYEITDDTLQIKATTLNFLASATPKMTINSSGVTMKGNLYDQYGALIGGGSSGSAGEFSLISNGISISCMDGYTEYLYSWYGSHRFVKVVVETVGVGYSFNDTLHYEYLLDAVDRPYIASGQQLNSDIGFELYWDGDILAITPYGVGVCSMSVWIYGIS